MKNIKITSVIFAFLISFVFILALSGCKNTEYYVFDSIEYFNTRTYVALEKNGNEQEFLSFAENLLSSLDDEFSLNKENSFIRRFNAANKNEELPLSERAKEIFALSKGYHSSFSDFEPAVYPLLDLWKLSSATYPYADFNENYIETITEMIPDILPLCNFDNVIINDSVNTVYKTQDGVMIDFGGVIKGYAAEKLYKKAKALGYEKGYISLGGSSMYILSSDDDLSVTHPRSAGYILSVSKNAISDKSVSTSGDYNRYYYINGKMYSHIIDVKTGSPIDTGIVSATVIGKDAGMGDALSTAICCFEYYPEEKETSPLIIFLNKTISEDAGCIFFVTYINGEQKQVITNADSADYNLLDNSFQIVNI